MLMEILIWPALALLVFAVLLRTGKRRDRIDWRSRGALLLFSVVICVLLDRWIRISALSAAEAAAAAGVAVNSLPVDIAGRYQPVLLPLYIAIVAVLIDVFARLMPRGVENRVNNGDAVQVAFRDFLANALLFVGAPALLYAWTANFASSGSILGDAARDVLMPIIAAYGAPAYWLQVLSTDSLAWQRATDASWPWNPGYRADSTISLYRFLTDSLPWLTLAVSMTCLAVVRALKNPSFIGYFVTSGSSSQAGLPTRIAFGPWRARAALAFTLFWTVPLALWVSLVFLMLSFTYVLLGFFVLALGAVSIGLIALLFRISKARAP
jgi:hypothetical protein